MELALAGKVAIVTGASRGIGRGIAQRLLEEGMQIAATARDETKLRELGEAVLVIPGDLSRAELAAEIVRTTVDRFGRIDLLVNNAGTTKRGDFLSLTDADWNDGFNLKFFGAMRLSRSAWPWLVKTGGSIVNIAGVGGRTGSAEFTIGGSVNAALMNLTKSLADRGVADGIRVNAINPGSIRTARLDTRIAKLAETENIPRSEAEARMVQRQGIPRFGEVNEIADAVVFLASAKAGYIQGAIIDIDGGMTRTM